MKKAALASGSILALALTLLTLAFAMDKAVEVVLGLFSFGKMAGWW